MTIGSAIIIGVKDRLGRSLAHAFAVEGHPIALLSRPNDDSHELATELTSAGHTAAVHDTDASNPRKLRASIQDAIHTVGVPQVVIYNASTPGDSTPIDEDEAGWARAMSVNVLGAKVTAETTLPSLRLRGGTVLFTSAGHAHYPTSEEASHSVGKAALRAYVQTLHPIAKAHGVHAASVAISGAVGSTPRFAPGRLARTYVGLTRIPNSEWKHELYIR